MSEGLADEVLIGRYRNLADGTERREAIDELFRRHYSRVAYWCLRLTGDREAAADLAQEVFVKAFRHLDSYQGNSKFSTWLYSIARNHCLSELRARATRPEDLGDSPLLEFVDSDPSPHAQVENSEMKRLLRDLIRDCLDETEKKVFALYYVEELSLEAITRLLNLRNASGAKAYLVSSRRKLDRAVRQVKARAEKPSR